MDTPKDHHVPRSTNAEDYQDLPQPMAVLPKVFEDGHVIPPHSHKRDQLLYAISGVMRISAAETSWIVPPDRALLMPSGQEHSVEMHGEVQMRTLYISPVRQAEMKVLSVPSLLRELIVALSQEPMDYTNNDRAERIAELIAIELERCETLPLSIPLPTDPRLQKFCIKIMENPSLNASFEQLAENTGASSKTLARLCSRQLGMSLGEWRRRVRFASAMELLAKGTPIKVAASLCGYASAAAFTHAFRKEFRIRPSELQAKR
ncbi:AraC family transcriptional regulator [Roseibium sp. SCP14]|uniref:AraC family transcriptional regulator n=1 Tax=Roseibium sp. SCP14 TaxID=3141375 RepID=UPI003334B896